MKKKLLVTLVLTVGVLSLTGCGLKEKTIVYEGKEMPVSEAEERLADKLEVDNPELDLEVNIDEETDD